MRVLRILLAFCVAPLVPLLVLAVNFVATVWPRGQPVRITQLMAPGMVALSYGIALVGGVPTFLLMRKFGKNRWWHYAVGGALLGALLVMCAVIPEFHWDFALVGLAIAAPCGALAGSAFWLLGIYRNP